MRWGDFRQSSNVEDRTGISGGGGGMRLGLGGIVIAIIASLVFGINPLEFLGMMQGSGPVAPAPEPPTRSQPGPGPQTGAPPASPQKQLVAGVLGDTEDVWTSVFRAMGKQYVPPQLVLFSGATETRGCGGASASVGPFYCPADRKLYLDTSFFNQLARMGGAGDFAQAYVIAHEVGHHVQNLLGTMSQFDAQSRRMGERDRNALSVRLELQADCYAGVWGAYAQKRNILEPGDLEEGMRAAAAVGDDQITRGRVAPERFTHGTSGQRQQWFKRGLDSGDPRSCDTFSG